eukprot:scaffold511232_cov43-Prasinocladus_malaysianus.AAC.1
MMIAWKATYRSRCRIQLLPAGPSRPPGEGWLWESPAPRIPGQSLAQLAPEAKGVRIISTLESTAPIP